MVHSFSKYRVRKIGNKRRDGKKKGWTIGRVEDIMPPTSLNERRHKNSTLSYSYNTVWSGLCECKRA